MLSLPTEAAKPGTGLTLNALNALLIGLLMSMVFVFPLVIFAEPTTLLENVLHAIRATTSLKEYAPSPLQTLVHLLMLAAKSGTGLLMPALNALNYGSPLKVFAHQFPLYATPSMLFQENASLATQVMIFLKVLAFTPAPTTLPQATLDAKLGPKESANNALKTGLSMIRESASLFLISVKLVKDLPAPVASMVMSSTMELASSHL